MVPNFEIEEKRACIDVGMVVVRNDIWSIVVSGGCMWLSAFFQWNRTVSRRFSRKNIAKSVGLDITGWLVSPTTTIVVRLECMPLGSIGVVVGGRTIGPVMEE